MASNQVFQQILAVIQSLPDEVKIDTVRGSAGRDYYVVWVSDKRFPPGEFFYHFQDDHEPDIRAWLAREEKH